ncbi:uncharacterized protein [Periplaneta americana]|uniref:uncharacterized protein n=1 Tax=Periplaneta americana TaxID=6978 RepID=UPI0037E7029A
MKIVDSHTMFKIMLWLVTSGALLQCCGQSASQTIAYPLPQIDDNVASALEDAERNLANNTLSHVTVSEGTIVIQMNDITMENDNVTTIDLTNLNLVLSPLQVRRLLPDLRLMNLNINATIYSIEVAGDYKVSSDSSPPPDARQGRFVLTLNAVDVFGVGGLTLSEDRLVAHGVLLTYKPESVVFSVQYQTEAGYTAVNEDRSDHVQGRVTERIFDDVTYHVDIIVNNKVNELLEPVSVSQLIQDEGLRNNFTTFASYQRFNLNDFIDRILNASRDELPDQLPLSSYSQRIGKKLGLVTVFATFTADGGWFRSLRTVRRTGNVTIGVVEGNTEVSTTLELETLQFGFNRYAVQFGGVGPRGMVNGEVRKNIIDIRLRVNIFSKDCKATLQELNVRHLEGISVRLTGLGPFNWVLSAVATSIANQSTENIIKSVEEGIAEEIREILESMDCNGHFTNRRDSL